MHCRAISSIVFAIALFHCAALADSEQRRCTLEPGPLATVVAVVDGETLRLDDGGEVRLVGALAPRATDAGATPGNWPAESAAVKFLTDLTLGKRVRLAYGGRREDRYHRKLAHVFLAEGGREDWVQGAMLEAGMARSYGLPDSFACAHELAAHEREARINRRGLWSNYIYSAKRTDRPALLMRMRYRYARVEGVVRSVAATRASIFVNFGEDWRTDFTARALKPVTTAHVGFTETLRALQGRRVAVTGWIERNNGPMIDLSDPSQITAIGDDEGAPKSEAPSEIAPSSAGDKGRAPQPPNENRPAPSETEPGGVEL